MTSPSRAGHPQKPVDPDENSQFSPISFPNFTVQTEQPQRHHNLVSETHPQSQSPSFVNIASSPAPFTFNTSTTFTSTSQHHQQQQQQNIFTPTSPTPTSPTPSATRPRYAERYATQIVNPMRSTTSLARSKTRKMFLNRVKNERDAGRFEARGEQMMMAEYLADRRRWEESMARDVDGVLRGVEGDIEDEGMLPDEAELRALDEFVSQEEAFEMALQEQEMLSNNRHAEPDAPFSDAEYDDIFMHLSEPAQDMDMS
ncbi:hypothetical protein PENSUB_421 [Penicillium subrubescens]|uniref:Uncharacterized protein n=2 Tax=Penicillium subrubescens TaxID=1316194 RepID=A0A1Q5UMX8_9EURO|nr:hypothetical protein PENSUB_421 [Penicillium subrubescens]